jgi:hypothetical protein
MKTSVRHDDLRKKDVKRLAKMIRRKGPKAIVQVLSLLCTENAVSRHDKTVSIETWQQHAEKLDATAATL